MAYKVFSQEQREAATLSIEQEFSLSALDSPEKEWLDVAIDLQCELTGKDAELAVAVEIVSNCIDPLTKNYPRIKDFLKRNTPQEGEAKS